MKLAALLVDLAPVALWLCSAWLITFAIIVPRKERSRGRTS